MKQEWAQKLSAQQRKVLIEKGTEAPFSGAFLHNTEEGVYRCAACSTELFKSGDKYHSKQASLAGWPSFADVASQGKVELVTDTSYGMNRTEVICKTCGGHIGHVFEDASSPSGQHYCVNSCALDFEAKK